MAKEGFRVQVDGSMEFRPSVSSSSFQVFKDSGFKDSIS